MDTRFGDLLRIYRKRAHDKDGTPITQARLGELVGDVLDGLHYSGAAVSDWERSQSQIHKDDRKVLTGLILILVQCGGIHSLNEANSLLLAGNYRPLDEAETRQIFGASSFKPPVDSSGQWQILLSLLAQFVLRAPIAGMRGSTGPEAAALQPRPGRWAGGLLAILGRVGDSLSPSRALGGLLWLLIWWAIWRFCAPLLAWPFSSPSQAWPVVWVYMAAASTLPLLIGLFTPTRRDPFWMRLGLATDHTVRFYTYLGAAVGFQVGFMLLFAGYLLGYYLSFWPFPAWLTFLLMGWPLLLACAAAHEIPFNQWRAFGRVKLADGAIFSVFFLFPLLWGLFFGGYYPLLLDRRSGPLLIAAAIALITAAQWFQNRKKEQNA